MIYRGNPQAKIAFLGESPGQMEDEQGIPFVGRSGELLNKMLEWIGLDVEQDIFVTNTIFCRPPGNRNPLPDEIAACRPWFDWQLSIIKPRLLVALGAVAAKSLGLMPQDRALSLHVGHCINSPVYGCQTIILYHPAYLLRNPAMKHNQAEYLIKIKQFLEAT